MEAEEPPEAAATRHHAPSVAQQGRAGATLHALADDPSPAPHGAAFQGVLIDGFTVPQGAVAPMFAFPDDPDAEVWDEFGQVVDLHDLCGRAQYEDDGDEAGAGAANAVVYAGVPLVQQPPSKVVVESVALEVRAAGGARSCCQRPLRASLRRSRTPLLPVPVSADSLRLAPRCGRAWRALLLRASSARAPSCPCCAQWRRATCCSCSAPRASPRRCYRRSPPRSPHSPRMCTCPPPASPSRCQPPLATLLWCATAPRSSA